LGDVTTSNHDTIGSSQNLVVVVETLLVLNPSDDLDKSATSTEHITDRLDTVSGADEAGTNHINSVFEAEFDNICLISIVDGGKVDDRPGKSHHHSFSDAAAINNFGLNRSL